MTKGEGDGARRSLSMARLDSQSKARNLPLTSGYLGGKVIFRCALQLVEEGLDDEALA